jgi:hypothetical protein
MINSLGFRAKLAFFALCAGLLASANANAQLPASDPLYQTVAGLDTAIFDAYNHCDLAKMGSMVAEDLEFYHDQTGLTVGRQNLIDAVKTNICGKVQRELVAGSLEVYPLKGYGAVEIGVHQFRHPGDVHNVGEAKFVQLWQLKNGNWNLTRVISFDHNSTGKQATASK